MQQLPDALAPLAAYRQFILWRLAERDGKQIKLPVSPHTLQPWPKGSDWQKNPAEWVDAAAACDLIQLAGPGHGLGFLFTEQDPFFFVDLDKCLQPDGTSWSPVALDILGRLPGAAVEVSQSGQGLHVFGVGTPPDHGCKNVPLGLELYTSGRFVALTGTNAVGSAATDCSATLPGLVASYFPAAKPGVVTDWTDEPVPEWAGPEDDDALIEKILGTTNAAGAFGGKPSGVAALWAGDTGGHNGDASSADAALAQHLAFWTGSNCERMLRLMWRSELARDKWDRDDYLPRTILKACSMQSEWYSNKPKPVDPVTPEEASARREPEIVDGYQYLGAAQQIELFRGCVYVQDLHRAFCPNGSLLKPDQFKASYGGWTFQLTGGDRGKVTKSAWEAFTESQVVRYPKAESTCFRPALAPGALVQEGGRVLVNTYVPIETPRKAGDAGPFLRHLAKLLPDERDRSILLAYMAACIQHKGIKFQWAPLIQGAEGNGKTLLTRCVAFAIGERYTHMPPAKEIAEKHNAWLFGKLFIGVEDVFVQENRLEVMEVLKPMITNDRLAERAMQQDQVMRDVTANFMLNSNHKDGVRKTRNDRRFAPFFTAQQGADDMRRDGMDGDYFPDLYDWLKGTGKHAAAGAWHGYAIVAEYLSTYAIPNELNPAGRCHRAPETSSTFEAISASMGGVEQEVLEAIDEGRQGFAGGWISSVAFDRLLRDARAGRAIPQNKRRELLQSLGYDWHPALAGGRVNNPIQMDEGKKPRLFIKEGHIHANLTSAVEVARLYQEAQGGAPGLVSNKAAEAFK